jgi:hypothetical protein
MQSSSEIIAHISISGDGGIAPPQTAGGRARVCATNYTNGLHALISIKTPVFSEGTLTFEDKKRASGPLMLLAICVRVVQAGCS